MMMFQKYTLFHLNIHQPLKHPFVIEKLSAKAKIFFVILELGSSTGVQ